MGRNFDYDKSYDENFVIVSSDNSEIRNEYSFMGVCNGLVKDYPLMYDGMNQFGLCVSGLAFVGNAYYEKKEDIPFGDFMYAPYEFIVQILGHFKSVSELKTRLEHTHIIDECYSDTLPNSDLHWLICDLNECIVVEPTVDGLNVYQNNIGVLTNNPTFPNQIKLHIDESLYIGNDVYWGDYPFITEFESRGTDTFGLKGDYTSIGRFQKTAYLVDRMNVCSSKDPIIDGLHILSNVEQCNGVTLTDKGYEYTIYSVVYDMLGKEAYLRKYDDLNVTRIPLTGLNQRFTI